MTNPVTLRLHVFPTTFPTPVVVAHIPRLARAGELLGIRLLDSLVWTRGGAFVSLQETAADLFAATAK